MQSIEKQLNQILFFKRFKALFRGRLGYLGRRFSLYFVISLLGLLMGAVLAGKTSAIAFWTFFSYRV